MDGSKVKGQKQCVKSNEMKNKRPGRKARERMGHIKKPDESYIVMIEKAINSYTDRRATLNQIYTFLIDYHPFFLEPYDGWKNSVRHNLSLNQCFKKLDKTAGNSRAGKGHYWAMNPNHPIGGNAQQHSIKTPKFPSFKNDRAKKRGRSSQNQIKMGQNSQNFAILTNDDKVMLEQFTPDQFGNHTANNSFIDPQLSHSSSNNNHVLIDAQYAACNDPLFTICDPTNQLYYQNWLHTQTLYPIAQTNESSSSDLLMPVINSNNGNQLSYFYPKLEPTQLVNFSAQYSNLPELSVSLQTLDISSSEQVGETSMQSELENQGQIKIELNNGIPGIESIYSSVDPTLSNESHIHPNYANISNHPNHPTHPNHPNHPNHPTHALQNSPIGFQSPQYSTAFSSNFCTLPYIPPNFQSSASDMTQGFYSTAPSLSVFDNGIVGQLDNGFFTPNLNDQLDNGGGCLQYEIVSADCTF